MNPRLALALAALLSVSTGARAQDSDGKDKAKAERLVAKNRDFAQLSPDEQQKTIEAIAIQIHGRRRKAIDAMIITRKGTTVEDLEKSSKASVYRLVSATQDKEPTETPAQTSFVTHELTSKPFGKLFADNDWEVAEGSPDAEALKTQTDAVLTMLKKTSGRVVSVHVESSASTLQNTGKAAELTFLDLSRKRAESAADFVTAQLAANGVKLEDDQVTLDYTGANGNGTSGPSSPFPCADPKKCATGSCDAPADLAAAAKKGALDDAARRKLAAVYDPFKYVQVSFVVLNETSSATLASATPGAAHAVLVHVGFKEKGEGFRWPRIHLEWPKLHLSRSHRGDTSCPRW